MVFRLVYCSLNRIEGTGAEVLQEIDRLLETSRRNNKRLGITGALLFNGIAFGQVLEGDEAPVRALYAKICTDPRNENVVLLSESVETERVFPGWAMAYVDENELRGLRGAELVPRTLYNDPSSGASQLIEWLKAQVVAEGSGLVL